MEAIILAGGLGTRLRKVVNAVPKVLAPINKVPFLNILLLNLKRQGINHVVLAVSYLREQIIEHLLTKNLGMSIDFSIEENPLGTGGAIRQAALFCKNDNIFVVNGDTFFDVNMAQMMNFHISHNVNITVAIKKMFNFDRYGTLKFNGDFVVDIKEKMPCNEGYINGGIYCLNRDFILEFSDEQFSFEKDILEKSYAKMNIAAFISDGYFIDIGVPSDYERANLELLKYGEIK